MVSKEEATQVVCTLVMHGQKRCLASPWSGHRRCCHHPHSGVFVCVLQRQGLRPCWIRSLTCWQCCQRSSLHL